MKNLKALKYSLVWVLPFLAWYSFNSDGWRTYLPLLYIFLLLPLVELFLKPDRWNAAKEEEKSRLHDKLYDVQLYLMLPAQFFTLGYFLVTIQEPGLSTAGLSGRIIAMGLCCGILGINVGHELGHRFKAYERWMAKLSLMTSLNMHFMHEHNQHHHKAVSTPEDPATAKYGEPIYFFWLRSMTGVYAWAWKLEKARLERERIPFWSLRNQMISDHLLEIALVLGIALSFNGHVALYFVYAALIGHIVLETVNYIEHYGLQRKKEAYNRYETVRPQHSWNSDHVLGRLHLFELSRHSDHHYRAGRKYQILRHMDESPQMPTGYPGMMLLALVPPLWFAVMNPRVKKQEAKAAQAS